MFLGLKGTIDTSVALFRSWAHSVAGYHNTARSSRPAVAASLLATGCQSSVQCPAHSLLVSGVIRVLQSPTEGNTRWRVGEKIVVSNKVWWDFLCIAGKPPTVEYWTEAEQIRWLQSMCGKGALELGPNLGLREALACWMAESQSHFRSLFRLVLFCVCLRVRPTTNGGYLGDGLKS